MVQTSAYRIPNTVQSDTEESVVGTEWHQEAIGALATMLRAEGQRRGLAWGICEQVALLGLHHEDGRPYEPRPDVMVLPRPLPHGNIERIHLDEAGVPLFIAELASESTRARDQGDKKQAYAAVGVTEYLLFDPVGGLLPAPLVAWRLVGGAYVAWTAEADGWWVSAALGLAFQPAAPFVAVRDSAGQVLPVPTSVYRRLREVQAEWARAEAERAAESQRRAAAEQRLAQIEEELRRLREGRPAED